ncbi:hypothetical protein [Streptomyces sp. NPDC088254]|uniref:hypothetical protein n=1 Tax=Streptomyces sp. NPDC088254 TaxID=3365847 RepID=UPI00382F4551
MSGAGRGGGDLAIVRDLDRARLLVNFRAEEVKQAVSDVLGQALPQLDGDVVDGFLNDFTTSDLRNADLGDVEFDGERARTGSPVCRRLRS